jgi:hypothetical protein
MGANKMECTVKLIWDGETNKWHTETDNILCLALESYSFDVLVERVRIAAPEMIELNSGYKGAIQLRFEAERTDTLEMAS